MLMLALKKIIKTVGLLGKFQGQGVPPIEHPYNNLKIICQTSLW